MRAVVFARGGPGLTLRVRAQGEVQEVCCGGACNDGLPPECNIDCAVRLPLSPRRTEPANPLMR